MVSKEQVEEFMAKYFPSCPFCDSDTGWNVSGISKNYVQCRSCGAKWTSKDFIKCKELKELTLWGPSEDGKGSSLKFEKHPIAFWQSLDIERLTEKEQIFAFCDKCGKPILIESTYWYDKTKKSLPDKKFCSEQCFTEALAEKMVEKGQLLFSKETTDEQLYSAIKKSQLEMTKYDKTYGAGKLAVFLRMDSTQTMTIFMTRALLEEIRILILQNELILRELKRLKEVQGS